jgi:hypothetical protein
MLPGIIHISKPDQSQRVYNRIQIDRIFTATFELIKTKLEVLFRWEDEGLYWLEVVHNIFPQVKWGPDGSLWVNDPIIVPRDPEESKAFDGTEWAIEVNLFPTIEWKDSGLHWVLDDIIVDNGSSAVSSHTGEVWDDVKHNLFVTVEEREGGIYWEVLDNIEFPDQDVE